MYYEDSLDATPIDATAPRPAHVPDKFWDPATGAVRIDALLKAYGELERRLGGGIRPDIPDGPDGYCIECRHPMLTSDAGLNARLHGAGFTREQAQLVYDLAHERVIPAFEHMAREYETHAHLGRLRDHFGGDAKWTETARQVAAWGRANLPPQVYDALASVPEGVIAMRQMMASGEPGLGAMPSRAETQPDEDELKRMMQDPRYWKKKDPAFIEKVSAGFRRLHGE